jgi:hypothetical protein
MGTSGVRSSESTGLVLMEIPSCDNQLSAERNGFWQQSSMKSHQSAPILPKF